MGTASQSIVQSPKISGPKAAVTLGHKEKNKPLPEPKEERCIEKTTLRRSHLSLRGKRRLQIL